MVTVKLTALLFSLFLFCELQAQYTLTSNDVVFSDGEIRDYLNTTEKDIIIPDNFDGEAVISIYEKAFFEKQLVGVKIPSSVVAIGASAFYLNHLTTIEIPNSVTSIGDLAFSDNHLVTLVLSTSLTSISYAAFHQNQLTKVEIPNSIVSIEEFAFAYNQLDTVVIPNSVKNIGEAAFYLNHLTTLVIPNSVTSISKSAFSLNYLTTVEIPGSITSIGVGAFFKNSLTLIEIPNSVTSIGGSAFGKNHLTAVEIPSSVTSIGAFAFAENQLTTVKVPNAVTFIGANAFYNNILESFRLPKQVAPKGYVYDWYDGEIIHQSGDSVKDLTKEYARRSNLTEYTLQYNLDGGDTTQNPSNYTIESATITLTETTKLGAVFEGWFIDSTFTNEIKIIEKGTTGDMELFAKFKEIEVGLFEANTLSFSIYPNPTADFLHTDVELAHLTILNTRGEVVKEIAITNNIFNISEIPTGAYMIKATGIDGLKYNTTFIKN